MSVFKLPLKAVEYIRRDDCSAVSRFHYIAGYNIVDGDGEDVVGIGGITSSGGYYAEAIVRAVNSHDDLVAACEALVGACDKGAPLRILMNVGAACDLAIAALSKARGE